MGLPRDGFLGVFGDLGFLLVCLLVTFCLVFGPFPRESGKGSQRAPRGQPRSAARGHPAPQPSQGPGHGWVLSPEPPRTHLGRDPAGIPHGRPPARVRTAAHG